MRENKAFEFRAPEEDKVVGRHIYIQSTIVGWEASGGPIRVGEF